MFLFCNYPGGLVAFAIDTDKIRVLWKADENSVDKPVAYGVRFALFSFCPFLSFEISPLVYFFKFSPFSSKYDILGLWLSGTKNIG